MVAILKRKGLDGWTPLGVELAAELDSTQVFLRSTHSKDWQIDRALPIPWVVVHGLDQRGLFQVPLQSGSFKVPL